ncbi:MAG: long-chain-fatty-acid--CoA ligase [Pseudomonadota bacterium]
MLGLMQEWPLLCHKMIDYAAQQHGDREVISRSVEGPIHRTNYRNVRDRALKVAQRLEEDGFKLGDRIATLAWNTWRHLESWYGIMGIGAVYHTLNPRLFPEQIAWIMNHAEDQAIFVDLTFVPIVEAIADKVPTLRKIIILTDDEHMPVTKLEGAVSYESWIGSASGDFEWKEFDENTAAGMCYTSGTTGDPKGVVYSHRSNVLHALIASQPDALNLSSGTRIMPVVPMFHANAWSVAFTAPMVGATMIMPGGAMDGPSIYELLDTERVNMTAAVPTVWLALLQYLQAENKKLPHLEKVVIGGSACPRSMIEAFQRDYGVTVVHAWGMTEMSPLGTLGSLKPELHEVSEEQQLNAQEKQGFAPFGVEMKITNDENEDMPWDGKSFGRLKVRGPAISKGYYGGAGAEQFDDDNYFDTGDVAHIDALGYMQITDRSKDVIKSGGEWISSIDLENLAVGHPEVTEAAVIGVAHPKWDERPLLIIIRNEGSSVTGEEILKFMEGKIAKWWMPDDVAFVDEIPHTATGKIQKMELREQFADYKLPTA